VLMNMTKPPFDDLRIRQAMQLTLDSASIIQATGDGDSSWVIKTVDEKFSPFYDPKLTLPKTDPAAAQKLIDSYVADHGGKPVEFTYLGLNVPTHIRIANAIQAIIASKLKNVNLTLDIENSVVGVPKYTSYNYQMTLVDGRWTDPRIDMPVRYLSTSPLNLMRWSNPTADAAINQMTSTTDPKVEAQSEKTVVQQVLKDVPMVWIERFRTFYGVDHTQVKNWHMFYELRVLFEDVWLTKPTG
jgi:peptide/nickel transport system substrate-binding protein